MKHLISRKFQNTWEHDTPLLPVPGGYWQLFSAGGMAFRNTDITYCSGTHVLPVKKGQGKQY